MSIFPTRILLATDGSKEADLAAETRSAWHARPVPSCTWSTCSSGPRSGP